MPHESRPSRAPDSRTKTFPGAATQRPSLAIPGYDLLREISRGGQGAVFEGIRISTGRRCAVKVLAGGALSNPRERARFDQEAKILGALDHPNIVRVFDRGTAADGSLFLVMEYISGQSLTDYLKDRARHGESGDPSESLRLFLKITDAVSAAHLRGIVHRDLKPANILIDSQGEPHILDFGLARAGLTRFTDEEKPEPVTMTGQFLGSLPWSSPEQADGKAELIDIRTDVYSLGIILYQMLTGSFPYEVAGTMRDVLNNIILVEPQPPSRMLEAKAAREQSRGLRLHVKRGKLNPVIDAIVLKALAKKREDRYQSAGELARDIGNYLSGRPTLAAGGVSRGVPKGWLVGAAAAALMLLLAGVGVGEWMKKSGSAIPTAPAKALALKTSPPPASLANTVPATPAPPAQTLPPPVEGRRPAEIPAPQPPAADEPFWPNPNATRADVTPPAPPPAPPAWGPATQPAYGYPYPPPGPRPGAEQGNQEHRAGMYPRTPQDPEGFGPAGPPPGWRPPPRPDGQRPGPQQGPGAYGPGGGQGPGQRPGGGPGPGPGGGQGPGGGPGPSGQGYPPPPPPGPGQQGPGGGEMR